MGSYSCCVVNNTLSNDVALLASTLRVVTEENRLRLLCVLQSGEHCVCELMEHVRLSQSLISHHLKDLREAGMVSDEKRGLRVYYSLTDEGKKVTKTLFSLTEKEVKV